MNKPGRLLLLILLLTNLTLWSDSDNLYYNLSGAFGSFADPNTGLTIFPTLLIPIGGNLEGMGTAYTAVASDSGFLEANPSGSSSLENEELSFLHHAWIADSNIEGVIYTVRFNNLGIGFGGKFLYIPFTAYNDWGERSSRGYISESIGTFNISYNFFSDYKFYGLAVGSNLKIAYRNIPATIYPDQSALAAMIDIGLLTRFNLFKTFISRSKNFSVGAVVKNLGFPALDEPLPTLITFGIAFSPIRPLILAVDYNLPVSLDPVNYPAEQWDIATGMNIDITPFLSIQSGFRFKGDNPRISVGSTLDLEKISFIVNYNLDLSGRLNPLDKFSVEAKLNLGDRGRLAMQNQVEEHYLNGLESYAKGSIIEAIKFWEMALEIDPTFTPARDHIKVAKKEVELQRDMENRLEIEN
jgi:hypothetical protein